MKTITFGCRLNTFESKLIEQIGSDMADVIVVNTCAVTSEAERQCRQAIRKAYRENPDMKIIVTGCGAQLHPEEYAMMPEVYRVLGNHEKLSKEILEGDEKVCVGNIMEHNLTEAPLITDFEGRTRAFLQIQQGCDHACTFCIVHFARGKNIGLNPNKVIQQANLFVQKGFAEIVLTGVDITSYPYGFNQIVKRLATEVNGLKRLRFGSLDPACVDDELIDIIAQYDVIQPHIHLSVQSGDNLILKRMGRRHSFEQVLHICQLLSQKKDNMVFGADFITGFPTETEEHFLNTYRLVQEANISQLHTFPYSIRKGTPAAKMPQVDVPVRKERAARLRELGHQLENKLLSQMIGTVRPVLIEKIGQGYTDNYIKIKVNSNQTGQIIPVRIIGRSENELVGEVEIRA